MLITQQCPRYHGHPPYAVSSLGNKNDMIDRMINIYGLVTSPSLVGVVSLVTIGVRSGQGGEERITKKGNCNPLPAKIM